MTRNSRLIMAYPGEWAFILGAKLAAAVPFRDRNEKRDDDSDDDWQVRAEGGKDQGPLFTGTSHIHITLGLPTQTTEAIATPTPTGDDYNEEDYEEEDEKDYEEEAEEDDDTTVGEGSTINDSEDSSLSYDNDDYQEDIGVPGAGTGNFTGGLNETLPGMDREMLSRIRGGQNGMDKGEVAGAVIGTLAFIGLLALLFFYRNKIKNRLLSRGWHRMPRGASSPDPVYRPPVYGKLAMSQTATSALFGNSRYAPTESDRAMPYPPAVIRNSIASCRREEQKKYVRTSLLRGRGGAASPNGERGIYDDKNPFADSVARESAEYTFPPEKVTRRASERFPVIASPPPVARASTAPSENPTLPDGIIKTLAKVRPDEFPYPPPQIPPTPPMPVNSHFSWSTNQDARSVAHSSISTDSEPRFRGVHSWVNNQAKRLERQERLQERIREAEEGKSKGQRMSDLSTPETPAEFKQHPGKPVEFGKHERLMSAELDLQMIAERDGK